jgi:hypothetical protein
MLSPRTRPKPERPVTPTMKPTVAQASPTLTAPLAPISRAFMRLARDSLVDARSWAVMRATTIPQNPANSGVLP